MDVRCPALRPSPAGRGLPALPCNRLCKGFRVSMRELLREFSARRESGWTLKSGWDLLVLGFFGTMRAQDCACCLHLLSERSRILMFRNQTLLWWSCSSRWPFTRSPKPGTFLNLLSATPAFTCSLPHSYSRTFTPLSQCST